MSDNRAQLLEGLSKAIMDHESFRILMSTGRVSIATTAITHSPKLPDRNERLNNVVDIRFDRYHGDGMIEASLGTTDNVTMHWNVAERFANLWQHMKWN